MIKVLIVDDSEIVHEILKKTIKEKSKDIEVIGCAYNGEEAVKFLKSNSPDIIIMDIEMPIMDGLIATKKIMEEKPIPIIIFSAATKKIANLVMKALEVGAVDVVEKPENLTTENISNFIEKNIINKIKIFYGFKIIKRLNPATLKKLSDEREKLQKIVIEKKAKLQKQTNTPCVGIASSTGGPQTLKRLFSQIEKPSYPIVVVQHIPHNFIESLRDWLRLYTKCDCEFVNENSLPQPGKIYLINCDKHLVFSPNGRFKFIDEPAIYGIRPSADYMFKSLGETFKERAIGVVLTGMGDDGKEGAKTIKEKGGTIIAEAEEDCIIFGMPKAVIEEGLADKIMKINEIARFLNQLTSYF